ncbi:MAG: hypothetical protein PHS97_06585 [Oscillospiraceae bacterium]|nr:hypothetical protein [Oscillospiraceae bacterium]
MLNLKPHLFFCTATVILIAATTQVAAADYVLRDDAGKISAFSAESGDLVRQSDVPTRSLPGTDARSIAHGIPVSGDQALTRAWEDFCS